MPATPKREPTYAEIVSRRDLPDLFQYAADGSAPGEVHLHYHAAPDRTAQAPPRVSDPGWDLLRRMVPYLLVAALAAFIICGSLAILAYTFTFVLAFLVTLVHSLVLMAVSVVALVAVVAVLAGVLRPLFTAPSVTVHGNRNRIGEK